MTSSGTYNFGPSSGEVVLLALSRCQVRRAAILQEHLTDARMETNLMLVDWANRGGPNLWKVDLVTQALTQGVATYSVDPQTIMVLDAYIEYGSPAIDRLIFPISRTEYASYPDKTIQNVPTVFWFDRLIAPTITLWAVPDGNGPYALKYYRVTQIQDANLPSGETPEIPYRWYDAFASGLTARLAAIYKPDIAPYWDTKAERAWAVAGTNDVENVGLYITPGLAGYFS